MAKSVKFLHCADLHLDSPFAAETPQAAGVRRTELRSDFVSAVLYAKSEGCRLFLMSGDVFEDELVSKDTVDLLLHEFSRFPNCQFVISPGNHDYFYDKSPYELTAWPDNVHIFTSEDITRFEIPEENLCIYGYAFTSDTFKHNPLAGFHVHDESKINILVAHGEICSGLSNYAPLYEKDLAKSGLDYVALGHIHKASGLCYAGKTAYAYPGCLEGRGFDELGYKGALDGEISKDGVTVKAVRFSKKRYETVSVDVTGAKDFGSASEKILEACQGYGEDTALKIVFEGITEAGFSVEKEALKALVKRPYYIEFKDNTLPLYKTAQLQNAGTVIGAFYKAIEPKLTSENLHEREVAILALKYGLKALNGRDLS